MNSSLSDSLLQCSLKTRSRAQAPSPASTGPMSLAQHWEGRKTKQRRPAAACPSIQSRRTATQTPRAYASSVGQRRRRRATQPSHKKQATCERDNAACLRTGRSSPFPHHNSSGNQNVSDEEINQDSSKVVTLGI